jgi:2-oxoglutarate ferredoxin oxidoreductase subunit beta
MIYGMTGGQMAPTTPFKAKTTTTPYGNLEHPFDATKLIVAAGACYAARWTTFHVDQLKEAMKRALTTKGFAFIEAVSQCPTAFGRRVGLKTPKELLRWFKEKSMPVQRAEKMADVDLAGKIVVGEFVCRERPPFTKIVYETIKEASNGT